MIFFIIIAVWFALSIGMAAAMYFKPLPPVRRMEWLL